MALLCTITLGISRNTISMCCSGHQKGAKNYGFRFSNLAMPRTGSARGGGSSSDECNFAQKKKENTHRKAVQQFNLETGETVEEFASSSHAADSLDVQKSSISLCCIGRQAGVYICCAF